MELDRTGQPRAPFTAFEGKNVLVTGHTGFKGSWLSIWLAQLGARVSGLALPPETQPNNFEAANVGRLLVEHHEADIRDRDAVRQALSQARPDFLFHLAAQPLVRRSYSCPHGTIDVNVCGTSNVLDVMRSVDHPCVVIVITSDKCYANTEADGGCCESDALGGKDPYSASKAAVEIITSSYRESFFTPATLDQHGVQLASVRAGNVVGGGDWSTDRIITDIVAALRADEPIRLRNPLAVRPWQHVLDALGGYLLLADRMYNTQQSSLAGAWNFGPHCEFQSVETVTQTFINGWGTGRWESVGYASDWSEAKTLTLNVDKAGTMLNWKPVWQFDETIARTANWYREFFSDEIQSSAYELCLRDIRDWEAGWWKKSADVVMPPIVDLTLPTRGAALNA